MGLNEGGSVSALPPSSAMQEVDMEEPPKTKYVFAVPGVPPSFNDWAAWPFGKQRRIRDQWKHMVMAVLREKGNVAPRHLNRVELNAVIMFATVAPRRDRDNYYMPFWKWTQDQLIDSKVIVDDSADHCISHPPKLMQGTKPLTIVTITYEEE